MKSKGLFLFLLFALVFAALAVSTIDQVQAARSPAERPVHPPACCPILFVKEGYYGVYCLDEGNDIVVAKVATDCPYTLNWDNNYVQLIVEVEDGMYLYWAVCDSQDSCISGGLD